jgi:hypothetical protein
MTRAFVRFFRDPNAGGGGGLGPSLQDILGGDGSPKPADLQDEIQKQEALDKEATNEDGSLKEGFEKNAEGKIVKKEAAAGGGTEEGLNADGTLKPGFKKDEAGKVVKDPEYKAPAEGDEGTEDDEPEEGNFWEAVDKITGREVKLEYPEGVDITTPEGQAWATSPEGVAFRLNAEREAGAMDFEAYLKQSNPRAYAFMLHLDAGGNEKDFFEDNRGYTLPTAEVMAASADVQAQVYKYELLAKGNSEEEAQALVEIATKNNKLKERSDAAWKNIDTAQKEQLAELQKQKEDSNKEFTTKVTAVTASIKKAIESEMGIIVPDTEKATFEKFVMDNLRYDNGKFFVVQELGENPKTMLESLFFQHKKGDLKTLVQRQAKTQAAQGLRLKLKDNNKGPGAGGGTGGSQTKHLPLHQIL